MAATDTDRIQEADRLHEEYQALTETCGMVDRSDRGKLALSGAGAVEFLNGQVTNELADLAPGEGCYAAFLTHKGKMLGDLRVLVAGEDPRDSAPGEGAPSEGALNDSTPSGGAPSELLLDTERVALQALFDMIRRFKVGYDVELHKRTLERSLLSLIGPGSREVVGDAAGIGTGTIPETEHAHIAAWLAGHPVRLIATDASGVDVLCDASDCDAVRDALQRAGAYPVSEGAAEIVRVERGRPRYGIDMDDTTIPQEAGLNERAVSFTKGCYVGQETVARLHWRGKPNRHLRGLRLSAPANPGEELRLGERTVGHLTSVADSPALGPIALALVRREAQPGMRVGVGEQRIGATVVALPFES